MLNTRQKCLLYFLKNAKSCSRLRLAKIFFLLEKEGKIGKGFKFYSFVPYKFGPYSFELFHDIEELEKRKMLKTDENMVSHLKGDFDLPPNIAFTLKKYFSKTKDMDENDLIDYVYPKYSDYTIFSEIRKEMKYKRDRTGICTIGYEGLSIDEFLMKLIKEKVQVLADVRKNAWSMKFGYKKYNLKSFCEVIGIEYQNFSSLGIPGNLRKELKSRRDYDILFEQYKKEIANKKDELETLIEMSGHKKIALMCFEKDPSYCHRGVIAEELIKMGGEVTVN